MPITQWSELSSQELGKYGEYYAKMEFASYGFGVYTSELDNHGIDFIAKSKQGVLYEVQVKSVRNDNYTFLLKSKTVIDDRHLICYIRFIDGEMPDCYVFSTTVFRSPDGVLFTSRNYSGLKSNPEYGITITKNSIDALQQYSIERTIGDLNRPNPSDLSHDTTPMEEKPIKEIITCLRKNRGLTIKQLSERCGYSTSSGISERLRGKQANHMSIDVFQNMLSALDCELVVRSRRKDVGEYVITMDVAGEEE